MQDADSLSLSSRSTLSFSSIGPVMNQTGYGHPIYNSKHKIFTVILAFVELCFIAEGQNNPSIMPGTDHTNVILFVFNTILSMLIWNIWLNYISGFTSSNFWPYSSVCYLIFIVKLNLYNYPLFLYLFV